MRFPVARRMRKLYDGGAHSFRLRRMHAAPRRLAIRAPAACAAAWALLAAQAAAADTVAPVQAVAQTQVVATRIQSRCGEAIQSPVPSFWGRLGAMLGGGPAEGEIPPPVFERARRCAQVPVRVDGRARYRAEYRFGNEDYSVDLADDPGEAVRLDDTGRVLGPASAR